METMTEDQVQLESTNSAVSTVDRKRDLERRFRGGLSLAADATPERFRVMEVMPSSPAFFPGLRRGQYVLEIDGRPASTYSLDEARRALRGDGSHPLTVTDASGKKVKIALELPST